MYLKRKGKLNHLIGKGVENGDPRFDVWDDEAYAMIMPWL